MAYTKKQEVEFDELGILREQMLQPEELFLLQYLKNANRRSAQKIQYAYGFNSDSE